MMVITINLHTMQLNVYSAIVFSNNIVIGNLTNSSNGQRYKK